MYNLLTGKLPFYPEKTSNDLEFKNKLKELILKGEFDFPSEDPLHNKIQISEVAKDLIRQILVKDEKKRPGLIQILHHDFFHLGKFPEFPDSFTLKRAPTLEEIHKYNDKADIEGRMEQKVKTKCLYQLIVRDYPEIKYQDINKYTLNNQESDPIKNWVSFIHKSPYGFLYYEMNNGLYGVIYKKENEEEDNVFEGLHLLYNEKTEKFYNINKEIGNDKDKINIYNIDKIPKELVDKKDQFLKYHNTIRQKLNDLENESQKSEKSSININSSITPIEQKSNNSDGTSENNIISVIGKNTSNKDGGVSFENNTSLENINDINDQSTKNLTEKEQKDNNKLVYIKKKMRKKIMFLKVSIYYIMKKLKNFII